MSDSLQPHGLYSPWISLGQNTGVGSLSLLQGIFPTQGSNPGLPHCRRILYQLSHKESPNILEWVTFPSPEDLPNPRIELGSPALQTNSLPTELSGKPSANPISFLPAASLLESADEAQRKQQSYRRGRGSVLSVSLLPIPLPTAPIPQYLFTPTEAGVPVTVVSNT